VIRPCDVDHDLLAMTSRARSIACIRIAISGRPGSSRVKFGVGLVTTAYSRPADATRFQMSKFATAITMPVTNANMQENSTRSITSLVRQGEHRNGEVLERDIPASAQPPRQSRIPTIPRTSPNIGSGALRGACGLVDSVGAAPIRGRGEM
jgi:hypothetical protein